MPNLELTAILADAAFPEAKTNGCFIKCDKSLQFAPGDDVKMTINENGNVGIGTTDPCSLYNFSSATSG